MTFPHHRFTMITNPVTFSRESFGWRTRWAYLWVRGSPSSPSFLSVAEPCCGTSSARGCRRSHAPHRWCTGTRPGLRIDKKAWPRAKLHNVSKNNRIYCSKSILGTLTEGRWRSEVFDHLVQFLLHALVVLWSLLSRIFGLHATVLQPHTCKFWDGEYYIKIGIQPHKNRIKINRIKVYWTRFMIKQVLSKLVYQAVINWPNMTINYNRVARSRQPHVSNTPGVLWESRVLH